MLARAGARARAHLREGTEAAGGPLAVVAGVWGNTIPLEDLATALGVATWSQTASTHQVQPENHLVILRYIYT